VEYIQPPAAHSNRDLLAIHRGSQHYGSPASHHPDNLYAPATVYVTAAGYQQIAIPPPAHHARPLVPPQAAVFQHPPAVVGPQYGYAPLSPGKTRYLYWVSPILVLSISDPEPSVCPPPQTDSAHLWECTWSHLYHQSMRWWTTWKRRFHSH